MLSAADSDTGDAMACVMQVYLCSAEILLPGVFRVVKFLVGLVFADVSSCAFPGVHILYQEFEMPQSESQVRNGSEDHFDGHSSIKHFQKKY